MENLLKTATQKTLQNYDRLRGKGNFLENSEKHQQVGESAADNAFWDVVVLTACDKDQEEAFNIQLERKLQNKELPLCRYLVVPDESPVVGCKIGAGGSTFLVIDKLKKLFPNREELERKKILLIHAGGWSQRLPSASVLGKLFMPLPIGPNADYDMLDVKLALYLPFLKLMRPGIFLTASDDIELFDLDAEKLLSSVPPLSGFVALGHPSTLDIGRTHGVFVCKPSLDCNEAEFLKCSRVLQKPNLEKMIQVGAIYRGSIEVEGGAIHGGSVDCSELNRTEAEDPLVVSDSAYWFDMETVDRLHSFFQKNGLPEVEVDCYGDFMQPLGSDSSTEYIKETKNPVLRSIRQLLFEALSGSPLHILFLPGSRFIHLGTIPEYLDSVLSDASFRNCVAITSHVMHSVLHEKCQISKESVLEYCDFRTPVTVGSNCFISGCSNFSEKNLQIPNGTFMHTVVLKIDEQKFFSTIFCGIDDDIKAEVAIEDILQLKIFRLGDKNAISGIVDNFPKKPENSKKSEISKNSENLKFLKISLWTLKIFPVCHFPDQSFLESLKIIKCLQNGQRVVFEPNQKFMSMADVLRNKDVTEMIEFRERLRFRASSSIARDAQNILLAGIDAVKSDFLIKKCLQIDGNFVKISDFSGVQKFSQKIQGKIFLLAAGKAALGMMEALLELLGDYVRSAILLIPRELEQKAKKCFFWNNPTLTILFGGMANLPNEESVESTKTILRFVEKIDCSDILICAISGGASALLVAPKFPVTLQEKLEISTKLMKSGAPIQALNTVRGALSEVKNGAFSRFFSSNFSSVSLILSDIVGDPLNLIGGAPTAPPVDRKSEAISVLEKFGLWENSPKNVKIVLSEKEKKSEEAKIQNILIGNNTVALQACQQKAIQLGYQCLILTTSLEGDAKAAAVKFADFVNDVRAFREGKSEPPRLPFTSTANTTIDWKIPFCVLSGGETTVKVTGDGLGGRNQEMVLEFSVALQSESNSNSTNNSNSSSNSKTKGVFISCGTDGQDGPTDAAGAITLFPCPWNDDTKIQAKKALEKNDSYNFFTKNEIVGSLIKFGMTGTNVMDLQILLID